MIDLLPGDIILITSNSEENHQNTNQIVPADCILLKGKLVINESMLTGENVPLTKEALSKDDTPFQKNSENMLY